MRIPVRDRLAGLDRGAVLDVDGGAVGQLVALAPAAVGVEHRQFARTRHGDQVATGVRDGLEVVELDRTGGLDRHVVDGRRTRRRSEEHPSELQSLMRLSYADFCLKKNK